MKIYGRLSSLNVQKVIWCLGELGLVAGEDYERIDAGLTFGVNTTPEYLAMNPTGLVPLLVEGDYTLWESNAIIRLLASRYGLGSLMPTDLQVRADSDRWMDWMLGTVWPLIRTAFVGLTRTPKEKQDLLAIKAAFQKGSDHLVILDAVLKDRLFCAGSELTVGDLALGVAVHRWVQLGQNYPEQLGVVPIFPSMMQWYARISERPAFLASLV